MTVQKNRTKFLILKVFGNLQIRFISLMKDNAINVLA